MEVIEQEALIEDPSQCTELMTPRFLEQTGFGGDPLASCRENEADEEGEAESVETSEVRVDGDKAVAVTAYHGGSVDGQTFELLLVKEDDEWKLDHIESFVVFERASFLRELAGNTEGDVTPQLVACIETLDGIGDEEIQRAVLSGERDQVFKLISEACPAAYRAAILAGVEGNPNLDPALANCIGRALRRLNNEALLRLTLSENQALLQEFIARRCSEVAESPPAPS